MYGHYDRYATCGKCGKIVKEEFITIIYLDGQQIKICISCLNNIEGGKTGWEEWTPHWTKWDK